jgi:hypothetical protein
MIRQSNVLVFSLLLRTITHGFVIHFIHSHVPTCVISSRYWFYFREFSFSYTIESNLSVNNHCQRNNGKTNKEKTIETKTEAIRRTNSFGSIDVDTSECHLCIQTAARKRQVIDKKFISYVCLTWYSYVDECMLTSDSYRWHLLMLIPIVDYWHSCLQRMTCRQRRFYALILFQNKINDALIHIIIHFHVLPPLLSSLHINEQRRSTTRCHLNTKETLDIACWTCLVMIWKTKSIWTNTNSCQLLPIT